MSRTRGNTPFPRNDFMTQTQRREFKGKFHAPETYRKLHEEDILKAVPAMIGGNAVVRNITTALKIKMWYRQRQ